MEPSLKDCYQFEIKQVVKLISGSIRQPSNNKNIFARGLSFDSREIKLGQIFLARTGELDDGHKYIADAFNNGASFAIVERKNFVATDPNLTSYPLIIVENSELALEILARFVATKYEGRKIAITGSLGKTSLKELLFLALNNNDFYKHSQKNKAYRSKKSYNNLFGVCWSVVNMPLTTQFAIFEFGMNNRFEILRLSRIVEPTLVIITNVADTHIGQLGSNLEIMKAKGEILEELKNDGLVVLPRGDSDEDDFTYDYFLKLIAKKKVKLITFGKSDKAEIRVGKTKTFIINDKVASQLEIIEDGKKTSASLYVLGEHWGYIIAAAFAACKLLKTNLQAEDFFKSISKLKPQVGRGEIIYDCFGLNQNIIIDDSYNASPLSVRNTIKSLADLAQSYDGAIKFEKVLILADMNELGQFSKKLHQSLATDIILAKIDKVILIGNFMNFLYEQLKKNGYQSVEYFGKLKEAQVNLNKIINKKSIVSIKGSNTLELSKLIPILTQITNNNK